jgi:hypothetical protein
VFQRFPHGGMSDLVRVVHRREEQNAQEEDEQKRGKELRSRMRDGGRQLIAQAINCGENAEDIVHNEESLVRGRCSRMLTVRDGPDPHR